MRMRTACGRKKGAGSSAPPLGCTVGKSFPRRSRRETAVSAAVQFAVRRRDVDPHGAGQSTGGGGLILIERAGKDALGGPGEFPALHYQLVHFPVGSVY